MKLLALAALFGALVTPLFGQTPGAWLGYVTYAPDAVATTVGVQDNDLKWLGEVARIVGSGGSTFLGRRDENHWMSLTNRGKTWLVQIHDESARFNFWGVVQPKTGLFTVERGVERAEGDRNKDASRAARDAVLYIHRARLAHDLFPVASAPVKAPTEAKKPAPVPPSKPLTEKAPAPNPEPVPATPEIASMDPMLGRGGADVWQQLVDGNLRFVSGKVTHPHQSMARIDEVAKGQHPVAVVVASSDSQVPPEVIFDQGLGDLYVIRTAGAVVTAVELGSIEYAVQHLGVSLVVVLGNKGSETVAEVLKGGDLPPNLEAIAAQIRPAIETARFFKGDLLDNVVRENTRNTVAKIQGTPVLGDAMKAGTLNIRAAYYDTDTAKVAVLP